MSNLGISVDWHYTQEHSNKIEIREIVPEFKGIFATDYIERGEYIFQRWNDRCLMLTVEEIKKLQPAHKLTFEKYATELYENIFVGPYENEDISAMPAYFINHSCDPNTWLVSDHDVAARRSIKKGEQVTIDYATLILHEFESSKITKCLCGETICRDKVSKDDWWLMKDIYRGHFLSIIQQRINEKENRRRT